MIALRVGLILAGLACSLPRRPIVPCPQECRGAAIVACGSVVLDCAAHGAVCSVEPDGLAVCVHPGGAE